MPFRALPVLAVFLGGCAGGLARWAVSSGANPPWALVAVNTSGAFVLALLLVVLTGRPVAVWVRPLLGTGFLGAWTTFSGIVVPTDQLVRGGAVGTALAYAAASVLGGVVAAYAGLVLGRSGASFRRRSA